MPDYSLRDQVRATLKQLHASPQRLLGQNFLCDATVIKRIAETHALGKEDRLLEIGPGLGALTDAVAASGAQITGLELDDDLAAYLQAKFILNENVSILHADALDFDYIGFGAGQPYRLYANVPYYITTPLLKKLLTEGGDWSSMTLMLQKEAAMRIVGGKGRSNGPLTVLAEYYGESKIVFDVPPVCFIPQPKVNSAVIDIERRKLPPVAGNICDIMRLAEAGFAERRKLLVNALSAGLMDPKEFWRQALTECGLPENVRAEQLDLYDFARLNDWRIKNKQ